MSEDASTHERPLPPAPVSPGEAPGREPPLTRTTWGDRVGGAFKLLLLLLFLLGGLAVSGAIPTGWLLGEPEQGTTTLPEGLKVDLVKGKPRTLSVPPAVREALGMRRGKEDLVAVATRPRKGHPLVLSGSTALDPTRLLRIRARFSAEVVEIGKAYRTAAESSRREPLARGLRSGDHVQKGDTLGIFYSVDVGSTKNALYDAIVQLKLDRDILERAEAARGSVPEVFILNARKSVLSDENAISKAENTLRTWNIAEEDVQEVRDEAEKAGLERVRAETEKKKDDRTRASDLAAKKAREDRLKRWARVELKAPYDAEVIERNVARYEIVVDTTTNLFVLGRVDRLLVVMNAPEDDLPTLQSLTDDERRWTVHTVGAPPERGIGGRINEISYLIDQNQHTAVVKGYIDNEGRRIRGGQYATATVDLPPPKNVVEIPMSAIVDDGNQCVVFVQDDPARGEYTLRRVLVTHRFQHTAFVRSDLTAAQKALTPLDRERGLPAPEPLLAGERVILSGVLELKRELEDREAAAAGR